MSLIDRFAATKLCISLAPDRIACVVRKGTTLVAESAYEQAIQNDDGHWQPSVHALQAYFEMSDAKLRGLPVFVTLSSRWCRMMIIPWSDALLKSGSAALFLQSQYIALYGDVARNWAITADKRSYGRPRIACAIEQDLLQSLLQCTQAHKLSCQSVESIIPTAWRAFVEIAGIGTKAFAVIEPDRLTFACAEQGEINAVQSQIWDQSGPNELMSAWKRWVLRLPELADVEQVMVLNLSGKTIPGELPAPFKSVLLPPHGLGSGYDFIACDRA